VGISALPVVDAIGADGVAKTGYRIGVDCNDAEAEDEVDIEENGFNWLLFI